jgi:hypothetical protein
MQFSFLKRLAVIKFSLLLNGLIFVSLVNANECELYPITVSSELLSTGASGTVFSEVKLGIGTGNYSWLTWDGRNDSPSLAESLVPPGNSQLYRNPNDTEDRKLDINDWVEGRPGVKNSSSIRNNLSALIGVPITVPVWIEHSGQGSQFDYKVGHFATIELYDYKLNGKGWISFIYIDDAECFANTAPVALDLDLESIEGDTLYLEVVATDADDDQLTYTIVSLPQNGTLVGDGPSYTYQPDEGFVGQDSFEFIASDGSANSEVASVNINVNPLENNPPIAFDLQLESIESTSISLTVIATDPDNDPLFYSVVEAPINGTLIGNGDSGEGPSYTYVPNALFLGLDSFTFIANDGIDDSNIATASITVIPRENNPPIAEDAQVDTIQSTAIVIEISATDEDLDPLTYSIVTQPINGTLTGAGTSYVYTPNSGFVGTDNFEFIATDGFDNSNIASVIITVEEVANNPPIAQSTVIQTDQSTAISFEVIATDEDLDPLTYVIITQPTNGTLAGSGPAYVYTPDPDFEGEDSFEFIANDGINDSNIATIEIEVEELVSNSPPGIEGQFYEIISSQIFDFELEAFDADQDELTFIIVQGVSHGTLIGSGPDYSYTPTSGFIGEDFFLIKANDGIDDSEVAIITFFILDN